MTNPNKEKHDLDVKFVPWLQLPNYRCMTDENGCIAELFPLTLGLAQSEIENESGIYLPVNDQIAIVIIAFGQDKPHFVNEAACRLFGLTHGELLEHNWLAFFNKQHDWISVEEREDDKGNSLNNSLFEWHLKAIGKASFWVDAAVYPVMINYIPCHIVAMKDITARKNLEQSLSESTNWFQNLIELAVDGILIGSHEGYIIDANSCFCEMTGIKRNDLIGKHITSLTFTEKSLKEAPLRFDLLQQGLVVVSERTLLLPDQSELTVEMRTKMMPDGTYQSIYRDISARKNAEADIRNKNEELNRLNMVKDQLFSIVAHDLRSPFSSFLGLAEVMADSDTNLGIERMRELSRSLYKSALNTYDLLENLLEWTRIQRGLFKPEIRLLHAVEIGNEVISSLAGLCSSKNIEIVQFIPESLLVHSDRKMITSLIRNLLTNAIKFSFRNSKVILRIEVSKGSKVLISIHDFGMGMSETTLNMLFSKDGAKGKSGTEGEKSSGLGIMICRQLVETLKGRIWAESELGRGSTFFVELP
ncbi:MAG: PAS domain-containing sensor histidine kinase [Bacteroidetes bacterium]|nr:PAS domain-containing sensor histidine kinase [Bacteroidota bacterium]